MSNKLKQKEAVFNAIINVMGTQDGAYEPTKEQRAQVNAILIEGFTNGTIEYVGEVPTDKKLRDYVSGLQSNWLRKDTRLNGGLAYVAKNPGSRTGSTDPQVKAMRTLLAAKTDPAERAEIQSFINKRLAELKPAKTVTVNIADLPAELQAKYSK